MLKKVIIFLLPVWNITSVHSQQQPNPSTGLVNWMSLEKAMEETQKVNKPILIDFYTDWCGWCKHMMKTTYSDPDIAQYLNNYFYPVKFNAEGKDTIEYLGKIYSPTSEALKAPHELAVQMLNGKMSYPTTLFLNGFDAEKKSFQLNILAAGYLDRMKIEPMLIFTVENVFRNSNYDDFGSAFEKAFRDSTLDEQLKKINWLDPKSAFGTTEKNQKKSLVLIQTNWCNSCKVMQRTSFIDSEVFAYADTTFRFIDFNPELKDTIVFKGQTFINPSQPQMPFHQLAVAMCKNNLVLPTMALLDEENNLLDAIPFYLPAVALKNILYYFGEDVYKSKTWNEFVQGMNK